MVDSIYHFRFAIYVENVWRLSRQSLTLFSEDDCFLRTAEGHAYHLKAVENDSTLSSVYVL